MNDPTSKQSSVGLRSNELGFTGDAQYQKRAQGSSQIAAVCRGTGLPGDLEAIASDVLTGAAWSKRDSWKR